MTSKLVRLNVNLNQETAEALKYLAEQRGISATEAVRRAISLLKFVDDEMSRDRLIHIMDRDGKNKRELMLL